MLNKLRLALACVATSFLCCTLGLAILNIVISKEPVRRAYWSNLYIWGLFDQLTPSANDPTIVATLERECPWLKTRFPKGKAYFNAAKTPVFNQNDFVSTRKKLLSEFLEELRQEPLNRVGKPSFTWLELLQVTRSPLITLTGYDSYYTQKPAVCTKD